MPNWIEEASRRKEAMLAAAKLAKIKAGNDAQFGGYGTVEDVGGVRGNATKRNIGTEQKLIQGHATVAIGREGQIEVYAQKSQFAEEGVTIFNRNAAPKLVQDVADALKKNREIVAKELRRRQAKKAKKSA